MAENYITMTPSTQPTEAQKAQMARRFGMFIHFGVNTFGNVEWSDGSIPALSYQPTEIDADQWVRTAYEAGMNYVIMITKHHDGFCLWDTQTTEYSVNYSGNKTDVIAGVAKACEKYGIKLGLYYSLWDRSAKQYQEDFSGAYIELMLAHLRELFGGKYGEIVELWLDGSWEKCGSAWKLDSIYDQVKRLQPNCQIGVNHTIGPFSERTGMISKRYWPQNYEEYDPIRYFPSDFRLLDPFPCREDDPKLYTFEGRTYYMPYEMTVCMRDGAWFNSNRYRQLAMTDYREFVKYYRLMEKTDNMLVINLPPNIQGKLDEEDIENLMKASCELGIARV